MNRLGRRRWTGSLNGVAGQGPKAPFIRNFANFR